ncbi:MAG TPA: 4-(cytidine 5'-diphospho)-2-C-methyl-D-erythritol kinase [Nitrospira sp.]|nr:4-(cytidine 5'-diphospho)-2-C-methyl-D-erythritol kinase [Nitrospira sp.]
MTKGQPASVSLDASLTVHAPAKVNLILRILDRRPDGYHNLWSIMHTVALEDAVTLRVTSSPRGIRLSCDAAGLSVDHTNLVSKAASAVLEQAQLSVGIEVELRKRIPIGAGLGGGSSDAAATILGLSRLLKLGWSAAKMGEIGQTLGSDVAFFLFAPSAIVSGRGEHVKPVAVEGRRWVVLVKPAFGIETKWAYQELAATRSKVQPLSAEHEKLDRHDLISWSQLAAAAENDFETPIFAKYSLLREIKHSLLKGGAQSALLSGSGATVFGLFEEESTARRAGNDLASDRDLKIFVVPTCSGQLGTS